MAWTSLIGMIGTPSWGCMPRRRCGRRDLRVTIFQRFQLRGVTPVRNFTRDVDGSKKGKTKKQVDSIMGPLDLQFKTRCLKKKSG